VKRGLIYLIASVVLNAIGLTIFWSELGPVLKGVEEPFGIAPELFWPIVMSVLGLPFLAFGYLMKNLGVESEKKKSEKKIRLGNYTQRKNELGAKLVDVYTKFLKDKRSSKVVSYKAQSELRESQVNLLLDNYEVLTREVIGIAKKVQENFENLFFRMNEEISVERRVGFTDEIIKGLKELMLKLDYTDELTQNGDDNREKMLNTLREELINRVHKTFGISKRKLKKTVSNKLSVPGNTEIQEPVRLAV
jgi:hypothetical protein